MRSRAHSPLTISRGHNAKKTVRGKTLQCVLDTKWKINRRPQNGIQFEGGKWRKENKREEVYGNTISNFCFFFTFLHVHKNEARQV